MNRRVSTWLTVILGTGAALTVLGLILRATIEVRHNRGAEIYVNGKGMQIHWVHDLTKWAAVFIATLVVLVAVAIYSCRRKRDLALFRMLDPGTSTKSSVQDK
jgi:hypothetical protein